MFYANDIWDVHLQPKFKSDFSFILIAILATTAFVSSDGTGRNPIYVFALMSLVASASGIVAFCISSVVSTLSLASIATPVITYLLFLNWFMYQFADRVRMDMHAAEELLLVPVVFTIVTAPMVAVSSICFCRIANRLYHGKGQTDRCSS